MNYSLSSGLWLVSIKKVSILLILNNNPQNLMALKLVKIEINQKSALKKG